MAPKAPAHSTPAPKADPGQEIAVIVEDQQPAFLETAKGQSFVAPYRDESFGELLEGAFTLPSFDLFKDEDLDGLVGIDFVIVEVTYRPGDLMRIINGQTFVHVPEKERPPFMTGPLRSYVSFECVINPIQNLMRVNRNRKTSELSPLDNFESLPFSLGSNEFPSTFVANDGSTGIYRMITAVLAERGLITLPEGKMIGDANTTILDTAPDEWVNVNHGELRFTPDGRGVYTTPVRIRAARGIRRSKYVSEFNPDGCTRYLA